MPPSNWLISNATTPGGSLISWRPAPCGPMPLSPAGRSPAARGIAARHCGISRRRPIASPRTVCRIPPGRCRVEPMLVIRSVVTPVPQTWLLRQRGSIARRSRPALPPSSRGTVAGPCRRPTVRPTPRRGRSRWPPRDSHWDSRVCWPRGSTQRTCSMDSPTCGSTSPCPNPGAQPPAMRSLSHGSCPCGRRPKLFAWLVWCRDRSWRSARPTRWRN